MDAKLKLLKVPDLKSLLSKASLPVSGKKEDLIARIIASPAASAAFQSQNAPNGGNGASATLAPASVDDDLLKPPEEFDWGVGPDTDSAAAPVNETSAPSSTAGVSSSAPASKTAAAAKSATTAKKAPTAAAVTKSPSKPTPAAGPASATTSVVAATTSTIKPATETTATVVAVDDEVIKRKARAERFGIPLVEPRKVAPKAAPKTTTTTSTSIAAAADIEAKKAARAARFQLVQPSKPVAVAATASSKPSGASKATAAPIDPVEEEKKRKRAERFGLKTGDNSEAPPEKKTKTS